MKQKKIESLELLNYEGCVLKAHRIKGHIYVITDEYKNIVDDLSYSEFKDFINGKIDVVDSKNRTWNFANSPKEAKPTNEKIDEFLKFYFI